MEGVGVGTSIGMAGTLTKGNRFNGESGSKLLARLGESVSE